MAGNNVFTGQDGNIYVDFDVQNLIVVDPNKVVDSNQKIKERLVDHENLVMYANLETKLLPRTKLAVGTVGNPIQVNQVKIAEINFMKPGNQKYLTNEYTNQITGLGLTNKGTTNKTSSSFVDSINQKTQSTIESGDPKVSQLDTGLLGITQINVKVDTSFIPTVTMELEDIQGRALFEKGDLSPYAAFFHLPYPPFYLTMKGYYGQAIRYQLQLISFNARFNSFSGNYQVSLLFHGFKYNVLNEISLGCMFAVPHMYGKEYTVSKRLSDSTNSAPITQITEGGTAKIKEVYQDYKSKLLIPKDFPELSVNELLNRLELFTQNIQGSWTQADVTSLTASKEYLGTLRSYLGFVYSNPNSWFAENCDQAKAIVFKGRGLTLYPLKKVSKEGTTNTGAKTEQAVEAKLQSEINTYNDKLSKNAVFGDDIPNPNLHIDNPIKYEMFAVKVTSQDIDPLATYKIRKKTDVEPSAQELAEFEIAVKLEIGIKEIKNATQEGDQPKEEGVTLFAFEGPGRFKDTIDKMSEDLRAKAQAEEERLTALLAAKFEDRASGVGFKPSIKNIITVIMASTEAFLRLMEDVHKKAWDVRNDPDRKRAILKYPSSDAKDYVQILDKDNLNPVYPWPQYFVDTDGTGQKYVIKYPGDRSVVNLTKGFDFTKWPEIEFEEEFLKGYLERAPQSVDPTEKQNEEEVVNRISLNALEFPQSNIPYYNREEVKFLFEIWERTYVNSHYNRFQRGGNVKEFYATIGKNESENIVNALGISSPFLSPKLKNYGFNFNNFLGVLSHISNAGQGPSIQRLIRDFYATPYLQAEVDIPFEIYDESIVGPESATVDREIPKEDMVNFENLVKTNVQPDLCDTFPFTDNNWLLRSVETSARANSNLFFNTKQTLFINSDKKVISNFNKDTNNEQIRPVTSFCYKNFAQPVVQRNDFDIFYSGRLQPDQFISTEGFSFGLKGGSTALQTTSILNTPYFVNALQNGVQDWIAKKPYPFVQGAYLLLNSIPLSTLRGTYKTKGEVEGLDYIAASLKRFGAVHKLPYSWILKIGSVYHRYKTFIKTNVDILDTCWRDFDAVRNYDPITNNPNKIYALSLEPGVTTNFYLQGRYSTNTGGYIPATLETQFIQGGFYPKLINDMNYFLNGTECFSTYSDTEIQLFIDANMKLGIISQSSADLPFVSGNSPFYNFKMTPWTCLVKNEASGSYSTIPSFGSRYNQVPYSIFTQGRTQGSNVLTRNILNNPSIFNGTVRSFWGAPNYGYFDTSLNRKPLPTEYMTFINVDGEVSPVALGIAYANIEDIFGVFSKEQLDVMEQKFLDFSKAVYDMTDVVGTGEKKITLNVDTSDPQRYLKNFQLMVREFFEVNPQLPTQSIQEFLNTSINEQFGNVISIINNFMEYNVVMKFGNPSAYNRRLFDSFIPNYQTGYEFTDNTSQQGTTAVIPFTLVDPLKFDDYIPNTLPTSGGSVTLLQSITNNRDAWDELRLQMGPSTIFQLIYTNNGSYITDFFVDNNIKFTVENVKTCAPLIRIYATQKLKNSSLNSASFKSLIQQYSESMLDYHKNVLNNLFENLRKNLPDYNHLPENTIKSSMEGDLVKAQYWEMFKALNDKWIAGNAYNEDTLLQDFLFVDRASRNVGDQIFVDIFSLKNSLRNLNVNASVFTLIGGILRENHFSVMPLPAFVNFYNIATPDGIERPQIEKSVDFANSLWGTFLAVDYRKASPKMVCFYSEKPSTYLEMGRNQDFRYKNDGFACNSLTDNPLLENQTEKKDYSQSNRCIGFNVDMGIRNQNIFYSFSVSQDNGVATAESLIATNYLGNQAGGNQVASQNVSLLNLYNERSYTCNVVALGNALIQPMMYFCLNHVPMFNGAYLITEVSHIIQPGNFQTSFTGVRQRVFDSIRPNSYLMSLNQNLLQKLPDLLKTAQTTAKTDAKVNDTSKKTNAAPNSCQEQVSNGGIKNYEKFVAIEAVESKTTPDKFAKAIKNTVPTTRTEKPTSQVSMFIYAIAYVSSANDNGTEFSSFANNYGNVTLDIDWKAKKTYFTDKFCCVEINTDQGKKSKPFANFETVEKLIQFIYASLDAGFTSFETDGDTNYLPKLDSLYNEYKKMWPTIKNTKEQEDFEKNQGRQVKAKLQKAIESIKAVFPSAGIPINQANTQPVTVPTTNQQVNPNVTTNADDKTIFSEAKSRSNYTLQVTTLSDGKLKFVGTIGQQQLSKVYNVNIKLVPLDGLGGSEIKLASTTITPNSNGTINGFTATTDKSMRQNLSLAKNSEDEVAFSAKIVEYPEYSFTKISFVMDHDCPPKSLIPGDTVSDTLYQQIKANPCGVCYPQGGRNIMINGKECLPNTAGTDPGNIYDYETISANGQISTVIFKIKPNVGIWKIFSDNCSWDCEGETANNLTQGRIAADGQSVTFDVNDIIEGCDPGNFTLTMRAVANPYTQGGTLDNTRTQKWGNKSISGRKA